MDHTSPASISLYGHRRPRLYRGVSLHLKISLFKYPLLGFWARPCSAKMRSRVGCYARAHRAAEGGVSARSGNAPSRKKIQVPQGAARAVNPAGQARP